MTLVLLKVGMVLSPFYELLVKLCPSAVVITPDTRIAKTFIGIWLAIIIGGSACFSGELKRCKNKWILLFLVFIPLSIHLSPQYNIELNGVKSSNFWAWKPFVMYLSYFLMFMVVQSLNITKRGIRGIFNTMAWCAFVMAGYVLLQNIGWDQFFNVKTGGQFDNVTKPLVVGTLGNSTIVSPYIAMIIPMALYLHRWVVSFVLICAVVVSQSAMAIGAMVVSLLVYLCLRFRMKGVFVVFLTVVLGVSVLNGVRVLKPQVFESMRIVENNGRISLWKGIVKEMKSGEFGEAKDSYPYTGLGLGSYNVLMKPTLGNIFAQAHNEYIQVFVETGLIGLFLFLMAIFYMMKEALLSYIDGFNRSEISALVCSFLCIGLVACGSFPWQIAPLIYLTVIVVGLLHNENILQGELE